MLTALFQAPAAWWWCRYLLRGVFKFFYWTAPILMQSLPFFQFLFLFIRTVADSESAQEKAVTGKITEDRGSPGNALVDGLKNIVIGEWIFMTVHGYWNGEIKGVVSLKIKGTTSKLIKFTKFQKFWGVKFCRVFIRHFLQNLSQVKKFSFKRTKHTTLLFNCLIAAEFVNFESLLATIFYYFYFLTFSYLV